MDKNNLPYYSPHKFRHGHIHYGQERSYSVEDFKAVSLNVMHAGMEITDQFYSNLNDGQVQNRITALGKKEKPKGDNLGTFALFQEFLLWKEDHNNN